MGRGKSAISDDHEGGDGADPGNEDGLLRRVITDVQEESAEHAR